MKHLSIIVTCKNQGENVERILRHLESVRQKDRFEIVIVDDVSTDNSREEIRVAINAAKAAGLDAHLIPSVDPGYAGGARNAGVRMSVGRYIWLVDGDDLPLATGVDAVIDAIRRESCDVYLLAHSEIRPDGLYHMTPPENLNYAALCEFRVAPWCKVIRRKLYVQFRRGVLLEDGDWWYRQCDAFDHHGRFGAVREVAYHYDRSVPGQTMESFDKIIHNRFKSEKPITLGDMLKGVGGFSVGMPKIFADRLRQIAELVELYQTVEHKTVREQLEKVLFGLPCSTGERYHGLTDFILP